MRRIVTPNDSERVADERELQFDVRQLEPGDDVDVFIESERDGPPKSSALSN